MFFLDIRPGSLVSYSDPYLGPPNAGTVRWVCWGRGLAGVVPSDDPDWTVTVRLEDLTA